MYAIQNFREGQFLSHTCGRTREGQFLWDICWRLKYKIENIKIETDQKILYNGINLA